MPTFDKLGNDSLTHLLSFLIFVSLVEIVKLPVDKFLILKLAADRAEILMLVRLSSVFSFSAFRQIRPVEFRFSTRANPDVRFSTDGFGPILKFSTAGFSTILKFSTNWFGVILRFPAGGFGDIEFPTGGFRDIRFSTAGFGDIEFSINQLVDHKTLLL